MDGYRQLWFHSDNHSHVGDHVVAGGVGGKNEMVRATRFREDDERVAVFVTSPPLTDWLNEIVQSLFIIAFHNRSIFVSEIVCYLIS